MSNSKDTVMIRLLDACVTVLKGHGMNQLFLDGVKGGYDGFLSLGKQQQQPLFPSSFPPLFTFTVFETSETIVNIMAIDRFSQVGAISRYMAESLSVLIIQHVFSPPFRHAPILATCT